MTSAAQWQTQRAYLRRLFETHVYGTMPPAGQVTATIDEMSDQALEGRAKRGEGLAIAAQQLGADVQEQLAVTVCRGKG